jgi:hypothetical protein
VNASEQTAAFGAELRAAVEGYRAEPDRLRELADELAGGAFYVSTARRLIAIGRRGWRVRASIC